VSRQGVFAKAYKKAAQLRFNALSAPAFAERIRPEFDGSFCRRKEKIK
jgi:hypothetical protein